MNQNKLPKDWRRAKLGEVCDVQKGITPRREWYAREGIHIIKFRDVGEDGSINWIPGFNSFVPKEYAGKLRQLRSGMTLISADAHNPEYIGRKTCLAMGIPKEPIFFAGELISVKPKGDAGLIDAWPYLWLRSADGYAAIQDKVVGVHLNSGPAKEIQIPFPPLSEQKRIVNLLDKQMAATNRACNIAEEKLAMACALPESFLRESFAAAENGKLPKGWHRVKLGEVALDMKDGGTPPRKHPEYFGGDINWCVVKDIRPEIWTTKETLTPLGLKNSSAKVWPANSVIISLGASIGNVGMAKIPTATKQGLSGIVVDEKKITPKFLFYLLEQKREFIQSLATGTTIKEIRPMRLQEMLMIPLPPLAEQKRIVNLLDKQMAAAECARKIASKELADARSLPDKLLREAFAGKV